MTMVMRLLMVWGGLVGSGVLLADTTVEPQVLARGKVVDGEGKAVAGARVVGTLAQEDMQGTFSAESGKDGTFEVTIRNTDKYKAVTRVTAWKKGYSEAVRATTAPLGSVGYKDIELVLRPAVDFVVNVVSTEGKAVAGAEVVVPRHYSDGEAKDIPWVTDGEGRAILRGRNDMDRLTFEVTAEGYLKGKGWVEDLTKKSVAIVLAKGGDVCVPVGGFGDGQAAGEHGGGVAVFGACEIQDGQGRDLSRGGCAVRRGGRGAAGGGVYARLGSCVGWLQGRVPGGGPGGEGA